MSNLTVVITMAGLGSRFYKAGYTIPKYQIEVHEKTLFEWSMLSLEGFKDKANQYIFIVRVEDNASEFIHERCKKLGFENVSIIEIDYLTDGQATTAYLAKEIWEKENELLIYNIDTYVEPGQMKAEQLRGDGFIPCFDGDGDHWSFVKLNKMGEAIEVREKTRVSRHCTLGAYYFSSCALYGELYAGYESGEIEMVKNEKYVAPLYNLLIKRGGKVYISDICVTTVHALGTPEELELFRENYKG